jgi:hypothetical protein
VSISVSDSGANFESGKSPVGHSPTTTANPKQRPNQALEMMIGSLVGMVQVGRLDQAGGSFSGF